MKNLLWVFLLILPMQMYGCKECVKDLCLVILEFENRCKQDPKFYKEHLNYDHGVIQGMKTCIKILEGNHPGCQLTLYEYEQIFKKKEKEVDENV